MNKLKKLHIAAVLVLIAQVLKSLFFPLLFGVILGGSREPIGFFRFEYIWIAIILLSILHGIVTWLTFRYRITDDELYIEQGLFVKKKRYIHCNRVQSIHLSEGVIQRLFQLVKVEIETAGGTEPKIELVALTKMEAEHIRATLLQNQTSYKMDTEESQGVRRWKLGASQLLLAALTSSGVGIVFSAIIALFSQIEQFIPDRLYEMMIAFFSKSGIVMIVASFLFILVVAWIVSIMITMLKYGQFQIEQEGNRLIISKGILERKQLTIQQERVTAVRIIRNLLRQPLGYATVYVESRGGGSTDEQLSTILLPMVKEKEIEAILQQFLPQFAVKNEHIRVPRRALRRSVIRLTLIPLIITIVSAYFITNYAYYGLIIVILMLILAYVQYRDAGFIVNGERLSIRYRKISQMTVITTREKIQSMEMSKSYFQRRRKLATFHFSILSSFIGKTFSLVDLQEEDGDSLLSWYINRRKEKS